MKILIVADTYPVASQTFIEQHVRSLLECGHDVMLLAFASNRNDPIANVPAALRMHFTPIIVPIESRFGRLVRLAQITPRNCRSALLAWNLLSDLICGRASRLALSEIPYSAALSNSQKWDVVHAHFGNVAISIAHLKSAGFIVDPLVVTFHGSDLNEQKSIPNCQLYRRVLRVADAITVGTRHMSEHLLQCDVSPTDITILPMGIDLSEFPRTLVSNTRFLGTRLATVGRLVEFKGIEYAILATAELIKKWPNITMEIIGEGPLRSRLEVLRTNLGLDRAVTFHGALSHRDTIRILSESDIYVHPGCVARDGTREGQGVALAEAQAIGLPVVASRVGGIPEIVADGKSAILVEPRDVTGMVECISKFVADPSLRTRFGEEGRRFVESHLDQSKLVEKWIELYRTVQQRMR